MAALRLNLGSGTTAPPGWINIDRSPGLVLRDAPLLRALVRASGVLRGPQLKVKWPPNVRRHDVRRGLPFATGSVEAVYTSHLVEHLPRDAAVGLINECRRVLQRGGVLRVAVPDLRALAERYVQSNASDAADQFIRATGLGVEVSARGWNRLVEMLSGARHKWMYDAESLKALLQECGFREPTECRYREGRCPTLSSVEVRPDSVFVEALA